MSVGNAAQASFTSGTNITLSVSNGRSAYLVGRMFKRKQQDQNLHLHPERKCRCHCQRAVKPQAHGAEPGQPQKCPSKAGTRLSEKRFWIRSRQLDFLAYAVVLRSFDMPKIWPNTSQNGLGHNW